MKIRLATRLATAIAALGVAVLAPPAGAGPVLEFPGAARMTYARTDRVASTRIPVGPHDGTSMPTLRTEGQVTRQVWTIAANRATTLDLIEPLRQQLESAGFEVLLNCETRACGGFDFRFAADVLPEPEMHVDLGDFRFLSARRVREDAPPEFVTLMVSRSSDKAYVQMVATGEGSGGTAEVALSTRGPRAEDVSAPATLAAALAEHGSAVLDGVRFQSGSASLGDAVPPILEDLAKWLQEDASRHVVLVGHTDASGSLAANIALSRKRARAVRRYLIERAGIPAGQVDAEGVGYLSPRASNETEEGRAANRRVEVVLAPDG